MKHAEVVSTKQLVHSTLRVTFPLRDYDCDCNVATIGCIGICGPIHGDDCDVSIAKMGPVPILGDYNFII